MIESDSIYALFSSLSPNTYKPIKCNALVVCHDFFVLLLAEEEKKFPLWIWKHQSMVVENMKMKFT